MATIKVPLMAARVGFEPTHDGVKDHYLQPTW